MIAMATQSPFERNDKGGTMGRRSRVASLTGVALVAAVSLVVVAGGAASTQKVTEVGFAAPEKPTDYGWNQQGLVGAKKAAEATGAKVIDATGSGYDNVEPNLRRLAQQGADLIIAHASGYNSAAPAVGQEFNVPVVVWDAKASAVKKGLVSNVLTRAQQGAYLAGVLAALTTKTGTLGIVVSASDENWFKQSGGYCQGARSVNKSGEVQVRAHRPGRLRRRRGWQAHHASRDRRRRGRRLRHGRRLVVRDDAGRRDGEGASRARRRSGSSTSSATSGRSTRRACCSRRSCGTSRRSTRAPSGP